MQIYEKILIWKYFTLLHMGIVILLPPLNCSISGLNNLRTYKSSTWKKRNDFSKLELESDFRYAKFNYPQKNWARRQTFILIRSPIVFFKWSQWRKCGFSTSFPYNFFPRTAFSVPGAFKYTQWFCVMSVWIFLDRFLPNWPGLV